MQPAVIVEIPTSYHRHL